MVSTKATEYYSLYAFSALYALTILQEKDALKNCCGKCEFLSNEMRQKTSDQMTFDYRFEYKMYASDGL